MSQVKQAIPAFCRGPEDKLRAALSEGGRFYPAKRIVWCVLTNPERIGQLAFCTPSLTEEGEFDIAFIKGDNESPVQFLDTLPSTASAVEGVLYIVDNKGYHFNGEAYVKLFDESRIDELEATIQQDSENIHNALNELNTNVTALSETVSGYDDRLESVEQSVASYDQAIADIISAFTDINQTLANHETSISSINDTLDQLEPRVSKAESDIVDINASMDTLEALANDHEQRISSLESTTTAMSTVIDTHTGQIALLTDDVKGIKTDLADVTSDVTVHDGQIHDLNDSVADIEAQLEMDFIF